MLCVSLLIDKEGVILRPHILKIRLIRSLQKKLFAL